MTMWSKSCDTFQIDIYTFNSFLAPNIVDRLLISSMRPNHPKHWPLNHDNKVKVMWYIPDRHHETCTLLIHCLVSKRQTKPGKLYIDQSLQLIDFNYKWLAFSKSIFWLNSTTLTSQHPVLEKHVPVNFRQNVIALSVINS